METMGRKVILMSMIKNKGYCETPCSCGGCPILCGDGPYYHTNTASHIAWKYEQALTFYLRYYKEEDLIETLLED
jgi:hypothetical protein